MKPQNYTDNQIEVGDLIKGNKSLEFSIRPENFRDIARIARSKIYSNPIRAVVREYTANAYDANVQSGKAEYPIHIGVESDISEGLSFFFVRDYGNGLSFEELRDIYVLYGKSTKRSNNSTVGTFGLGCKSGFSYTNQFHIISYNKGNCDTYIAYLNENDDAELLLIDSKPTEESSGLCIKVPVKNREDEKHFVRYIKSTLIGFNNRFTTNYFTANLISPSNSNRVLLNKSVCIYSDDSISFQLDYFKQVKYLLETSINNSSSIMHNSYIGELLLQVNVLGIIYELDELSRIKVRDALTLKVSEALKKASTDSKEPKISLQILKHYKSIVIRVPPEHVIIAASRESCTIREEFINSFVESILNIQTIVKTFYVEQFKALKNNNYTEDKLLLIWLVIFYYAQQHGTEFLPAQFCTLVNHLKTEFTNENVFNSLLKFPVTSKELGLSNLVEDPILDERIYLLSVFNSILGTKFYTSFNREASKFKFYVNLFSEIIDLEVDDKHILFKLISLFEEINGYSGKSICLTGSEVFTNTTSKHTYIVGSGKQTISKTINYLDNEGELDSGVFSTRKNESYDISFNNTRLLFEFLIYIAEVLTDNSYEIYHKKRSLQSILEIPVILVNKKTDLSDTEHNCSNTNINSSWKRLLESNTQKVDTQTFDALIDGYRYYKANKRYNTKEESLLSFGGPITFHLHLDQDVDLEEYRKQFTYIKPYDLFEIDTALANCTPIKSNTTRRSNNSLRKPRPALPKDKVRLHEFKNNADRFAYNSVKAGLKIEDIETNELEAPNIFYIERKVFESFRNELIMDFWSFFNVSRNYEDTRILVIGDDTLNNLGKRFKLKHCTLLVQKFIDEFYLGNDNIAQAMLRYFCLTDSKAQNNRQEKVYGEIFVSGANHAIKRINNNFTPRLFASPSDLSRPNYASLALSETLVKSDVYNLVDQDTKSKGLGCLSEVLYPNIPETLIATLLELERLIPNSDFKDYISKLSLVRPFLGRALHEYSYLSHLLSVATIVQVFPKFKDMLLSYLKYFTQNVLIESILDTKSFLRKYQEIVAYFNVSFKTHDYYQKVIMARAPLMIRAIDTVFEHNSLLV